MSSDAATPFLETSPTTTSVRRAPAAEDVAEVAADVAGSFVKVPVFPPLKESVWFGQQAALDATRERQIALEPRQLRR